jgi:UDP-N-acetylglucosamine 2-epimerase (non-hydrolysing)
LKKVSIIFGTRPEAIKLCPLIMEMRRQDSLTSHVCVTGQHRELLDQVLDLFGIVPDTDLNLMKPNQELSSLTGVALNGINSYLVEQRPDMVVVQGDTTTTFCAALAAYYNQIPVAHVEAGLRTGNTLSPYPEEINRILTSRLANLHFAATEWAKENLLREGVSADSIFVSGNTVIDALYATLEKLDTQSIQISGLPAQLMSDSQKSVVLITGHRRESFGAGFRSICGAIRQLALEFKDTSFVYPVHLNPNVKVPVTKLLGNINNVHLIDPLGYPEFVALLDRAKLVMTDSGGIQEEAPALGTPVLVMREITERPEAITAGAAILAGTETEQIVRHARALLNESNGHHTRLDIFGDGKASQRITHIIIDKLTSSAPLLEFANSVI